MRANIGKVSTRKKDIYWIEIEAWRALLAGKEPVATDPRNEAAMREAFERQVASMGKGCCG